MTHAPTSNVAYQFCFLGVLFYCSMCYIKRMLNLVKRMLISWKINSVIGFNTLSRVFSLLGKVSESKSLCELLYGNVSRRCAHFLWTPTCMEHLWMTASSSWLNLNFEIARIQSRQKSLKILWLASLAKSNIAVTSIFTEKKLKPWCFERFQISPKSTVSHPFFMGSAITYRPY